jgi:hypothetical protein
LPKILLGIESDKQTYIFVIASRNSEVEKALPLPQTPGPKSQKSSDNNLGWMAVNGEGICGAGRGRSAGGRHPPRASGHVSVLSGRRAPRSRGKPGRETGAITKLPRY